MINNDNSPWERVKTDIKFNSYMKLYSVPNKNNQFYLFGTTKTSKITFNDDQQIHEQKIDSHSYDFYFNSDPVLLMNGELMVLG